MGTTELWLVRHGESTANIAADRAEKAGAELIEVEQRDADVPLSPLGERQASAVGGWLRDNIVDSRVGSAWVSSYTRARQTLSIALASADLELPVTVDERLRDRELGILDLLTTVGVEKRFPAEAARRRWLGKFYYRPPGGESWADLALRLRSALRDFDERDLHERGAGKAVLVVAHDAVVLNFVYVCTGMSEHELMDFARANSVGNASVTRLTRAAGEQLWKLESFAFDAHVERAGLRTTEHTGDKRVHIH